MGGGMLKIIKMYSKDICYFVYFQYQFGSFFCGFVVWNSLIQGGFVAYM
jgi:hypothetical protein